MTRHPAGSTVHYRVTYLEMTRRPDWDWPSLPFGEAASLLRAEAPPPWYFLTLYDAVGRDYAWEDMHAEPEAVLADWLSDPATALWTMMRQGWPQGFFLLDAAGEDETQLAYFGLVRSAIGRGLGTWLLRTAILTAWERPGLQRLSVNTCSLDHPRALASYQRNGFSVVRQESCTRTLVRDLDLTNLPG